MGRGPGVLPRGAGGRHGVRLVPRRRRRRRLASAGGQSGRPRGCAHGPSVRSGPVDPGCPSPFRRPGPAHLTGAGGRRRRVDGLPAAMASWTDSCRRKTRSVR
ncbi:hypothetical protein [Ornithinimicrobium kibberense]|uniref:hypothetical protein n=1 Tax=Ornithinimicrobium kibberense TaxID=282060 RepID=UPI0036227A98